MFQPLTKKENGIVYYIGKNTFHNKIQGGYLGTEAQKEILQRLYELEQYYERVSHPAE